MTQMLPVEINGHWTLLLPEHRAARPDWTSEKGWERARLDAMHRRIQPGMVVFDCGAEEGDFPALYASWGAQVVLFEPNPLVFPNIRAIWEANKLPAPLGVFAGFACNQTNLHPANIEPIFTEPNRDGWPACAYGAVIGDHGFRNVCERPHDTPQVKIDDYCTSHAVVPDVLTMDVEGAELEVLKGAEQTLRQHRPLVFASVHPTFMQDMYQHTPNQLHRYMLDLDYIGTHIATDHEQHWVYEPL